MGFDDQFYFSRIFKERFGTTLVDHIMRERTAAAERMLANGELSVDGIAEKCGFGEQTYFSRCYKAHYGISPAHRRAARK